MASTPGSPPVYIPSGGALESVDCAAAATLLRAKVRGERGIKPSWAAPAGPPRREKKPGPWMFVSLSLLSPPSKVPIYSYFLLLYLI
ncbi:hypothetical protein MRS44_009945 [Fusarium solani]|uniref:uncharacterized protein n=1 Tax=Fusarium solani TaxID=169388 RepID=UPI0032C464FE|nr:hypothetical protein MRS44_009945 [Fusarium solani]